MRNTSVGFIFAAVLALTTTVGRAEPQPATLLEWRFAGTRALLDLEELETFREVHQMPETARLHEGVLESLATRAASRFSQPGEADPAASKQAAALIKPLFRHLAESESLLVLRSPAKDSSDWGLALRASEAEAELWSTNLWRLVGQSRLAEPSASENGNWNASSSKYHLAFTRKNGWIAFAGGHSGLATHAATAAELLKSSEKPIEGVLQARINLPAFGAISGRDLSHAPSLDLSATTRGEGLRSVLEMEYPADLGITPEPWKIPAELIQEPLISFTALQGFKGHLARIKEFTSLEPKEVPNQLFIWGQSITPFSISLALKVGDAAGFVDRVANHLLKEKNDELKRMALGELRYFEELHRLVWNGLPVVVPFLTAAPEPSSDHVMAGLFPFNDPAPKPAPEALLRQLEKPGLIAYDWEVTGAKIAQWRPLWQMSRFLRGHQIPGPSSASESWIPAVAPKLGNTITEATLKGKRQIEIVRQSELGFNALELVLLAHLADPAETPPATSAPAGRPSPGPRRGSPPPLDQSSGKARP